MILQTGFERFRDRTPKLDEDVLRGTFLVAIRGILRFCFSLRLLDVRSCLSCGKLKFFTGRKTHLDHIELRLVGIRAFTPGYNLAW